MAAAGSHKDGARFTLTERQREVMDLMAQGKTNFEIAQHLGISLEGAKYHVREILTKLQVDTREEAVAAWRQPRKRFARGLPLTGWITRIAIAGVASAACAGIVIAFVLASGGGTGPSTPAGVTAPTDADLSPTAAAATTPSTTPAESKGPPVLWLWDTGNPRDMTWFGVGPSTVAVAVAPLSTGPGYVAGLDLTTGEERWRYATSSVPFPPLATSHLVVFGTASGQVYALDPTTGAERWRRTSPASHSRLRMLAAPLS